MNPSEAAVSIELGPDCRVTLRQMMAGSAAQTWMRLLLAEVPLEERAIVLFGRTILQPRLIGWAGDVPYTYSRQTLSPRPFGPELGRLLAWTREVTGHDFNHALVNYYRTGKDSMGMHSDDEPELGQDPVIASWSFGAERGFVLAEKRGKKRARLRLQSGCLLVMEGSTQHHFRHGLPKEPQVTEPRLNVTLRKIQP